jgi:hypothetical protein
VFLHRSGGEPVKTALRIIALVLSALVGLGVLIHGIVLAAEIHGLVRENQTFMAELVKCSVFIAGGICVLSVAVEQLYCWRTHRKEDSLI